MSDRSTPRRAGLFVVAALACSFPLQAQIFTVTSLADSGPGTLREQLTASYTVLGATINFSVSGTINLLSTLAVPFGHRNNLTIDGANQITISGGGNVRVFGVPFPLEMTITNLTIANGKADFGGGLVSNGFLTLKNVTFRDNFANLGGGAIASFDEYVTVDSCTFENNSTDVTGAGGNGRGGAIFMQTASDLLVVNSTFTNNRAFQGGAILSNSGHEVILDNTTVAGNTAQSGGGLFADIYAARFHLKNLVLANNTGGNCATTIASPAWVDHGGNVVYPDNTCPGLVADPRLGPLANNGGPTQTMALLAGSAAIDHAVDCLGLYAAPLTVDQRGFPRPQGSACDSGAYEASLLAMAFTGFYSPIANLPQVNSENAGRAIPISFSVGRFAGMNIFAAGYPGSRPVSCATGQPTGALTPIDTPGNSGLSFDQFQNRYSINWKTSKSWEGQCRELVVRLTDSVDHTALFRFR